MILMHKKISLSDYNIDFGPIASSLKAYLSTKSYTKIVLLVDENSRKHCLPLISDCITDDTLLLEIKSGEKYKCLPTCESIWAAMASAQFDRHSLMINLGGGVIGDMGGFIASCYMRGIDFIQIPTTLLSQVDASVGGKLAIDFKGFKNFIGLFKDPKAVLVDTQFLKTLPQEEVRSGYAEMIKHGLIRSNDIWQDLSKISNPAEQAWEDEVFDSVSIKKDVVTEDPTEQGLRKILNFGHTIGHAIESLSLTTDKPLLHGEAIGLGMIAETYLSEQVNNLSAAESATVVTYLSHIYKGVHTDTLTREDKLIELMKSDKKNKGGKTLFVLLDKIGHATFDHEASSSEIKKAIQRTLELLQS